MFVKIEYDKLITESNAWKGGIASTIHIGNIDNADYLQATPRLIVSTLVRESLYDTVVVYYHRESNDIDGLHELLGLLKKHGYMVALQVYNTTLDGLSFALADIIIVNIDLINLTAIEDINFDMLSANLEKLLQEFHLAESNDKLLINVDAQYENMLTVIELYKKLCANGLLANYQMWINLRGHKAALDEVVAWVTKQGVKIRIIFEEIE
jgi:hypothetical protein